MLKSQRFIFLALLFTAVGIGVYSNVREQKAVDRAKLPQKIELSKGFQRWLTNIKNKGVAIEADGFRLKEENEVYNSKWTSVASVEAPGEQETYDKTITEHQNIKKVVFSPSKREFLDYRNIERHGYKPNEVRFYGLKEDKIINTKIVDCSLYANCYFDRAYFVNNDLFVIHEISRNIDKKDTTSPPCDMGEICAYTYKVHVIDMINNSRTIYESGAFETVLETLIPQL